MRAWILRVVLVLWMVFYALIHLPLMIPLVAVQGLTLAVPTGTLVIGVWGSVFYFLLRRESVLTGAKIQLARIRDSGGVLGWVHGKIPSAQNGTLLSPFWIQVSFALFGAWVGVLLLRLTYPDSHLLRALFWVWLGAAVNTIVSVLVIYGPPAILARELITALLGR
ncbi:MAG TPA: hypothetical protein VI794_02590 [Patescibacteria group bacterium]|nr:hypothetical protein [Patescibacteria group bacterium]